MKRGKILIKSNRYRVFRFSCKRPPIFVLRIYIIDEPDCLVDGFYTRFETTG